VVVHYPGEVAEQWASRVKIEQQHAQYATGGKNEKHAHTYNWLAVHLSVVSV